MREKAVTTVVVIPLVDQRTRLFKQQEKLVGGLADRFKECITEKNGTLIRYDIIQDLQKLYDVVKDDNVREKALELIETEEDGKYRKKYASLWRVKGPAKA